MNKECKIHQSVLQTADALRGLGLAEHTVWAYYSSTFLPVVRFLSNAAAIPTMKNFSPSMREWSGRGT